VPNTSDHHREGAIVWIISWEFPIDPVADATESERYRDAYCEYICDLEESVSISLSKKKDRKKNSEKSSMEAHPSLPDR
jgi:hypothetical protein